MRTRTLTATLATTVLLAVAAPAVAHDLIIDTTPIDCGDTIEVTVTPWDGFVDGVYQGDDSRSVAVGVFVDGIQKTTGTLQAPDFTITRQLVIETPGDHTIEARPISAWGDGAPADPNDGRGFTTTIVACPTTTTTIEGPTTTITIDPPTTSTIRGCLGSPATPGVPCPNDYDVPPQDQPVVQEMPDPDPVAAVPSFTG